jgi:hypothetical protein
MEQKIETGGTNKTSTPTLKFLIKRALLELDRTARHIEHCASATGCSSKIRTTTPATRSKYLNAGKYLITDFPGLGSLPVVAP